MISSAVKQGLGKFNAVQSIDFDVESTVQFMMPTKDEPINPPAIKVDPDYNPFDNQKNKGSFAPRSGTSHHQNTGWEKLYENDFQPGRQQLPEASTPIGKQEPLISQDADEKVQSETLFQLQNKYIISVVKSGLMVIHQQRAYERIFFEAFLKSLESGKGFSQQLLFPETIQLPAGDSEIIKSIFSELKTVGFDLEEFGENTFIIHGLPSGLNNHNCQDVLEDIIENFKKNRIELDAGKRINLARSMAVNMAAGMNGKLLKEEMMVLIDRLFACKVPDVSPDGKLTVRITTVNEFDQLFK
jgi:DNA mismatch repair protein MutL